MLEVAAEFNCPVVLPFLDGPDPLHLRHTTGDPIVAMVAWFEAMLRKAAGFGVRDNMILDPGTGFAPLGWEWESRYHYQKHVYSNLDQLRVFGLPIYIALPWKDTPQHHELLDIVIRQRVEWGRCHYPLVVRAAEHRLSPP
jgi:dihydropteroate synthase